jgi:DNA processing protein
LTQDRPVNLSEATLWLSFARIAGLGCRGRISLLQHFESIEALFAANRETLRAALETNDISATGLRDPHGAIDAILRGPDPTSLTADLGWLAEERHHLISWFDADYPPLLREIADPPAVLYVHGSRAALACPQLAIVGSRNPTPVGSENAGAFARALAREGIAVTSGLALGIDGAAHRGALAGGGVTIAVAGTGLDRVYPARHRELAHAIIERGALVSEFPIGTPARAGNFPVRNRLISGLSLGVLVVEAALESGSLITARLAVEQGREVFALPGSIHSSLSRGCHALIRQGAKLVETMDHILEELGPLARLASQSRTTTRIASDTPTLEPLERRLFDCLGYDPMHIDAVIERSRLTADAVSSILLQLELRGLVLAGPSGYQRAPGKIG